MEKPNFIRTVSPAQQQALARWFYLTILLLSIAVITILIIQVKRSIVLSQVKHTYSVLQHHTQNFDALVAEQQNLKNNITAVKEKIDHIKKIAQNNKQIIDTLELIKEQSLSMSLEQFEVNKKEVTITFKTDKIYSLDSLIKALNQLKSLKAVQLDTLKQTAQNTFLITIKGELALN